MFSKNTSFWCIVVFLIVLMVIHHILNDKPLIEGQQNKGNVDMGDVSNIRISLKGPPGVVRQALSAETVPIEAVEEGRDAEETVSEEERVAAEAAAKAEEERVATNKIVSKELNKGEKGTEKYFKNLYNKVYKITNEDRDYLLEILNEDWAVVYKNKVISMEYHKDKTLIDQIYYIYKHRFGTKI